MSGRRNRTRARLAQNLFANEASARTLVRLADVSPGDLVLDLGAGAGAVTAALVAAGARVVAVERDPNLARKLRTRFAGAAVSVLHADLRDVAFAAPFRVVANPPFNATADLLRRLLDGAPSPASATLVLQRQAAERYAGLTRLGAAALAARPWFEFEVLRPFGRRDFTPAPSVDVAVLRLQPKRPPDLPSADRDAWRAFVGHVLARPQRDAWRAFRSLVSNLQWRRLAADLGIAPDALRANLSYDQWLGVFRFTRQFGGPRSRRRLTSRPEPRRSPSPPC